MLSLVKLSSALKQFLTRLKAAKGLIGRAYSLISHHLALP
jgi:hypothetical protein